MAVRFDASGDQLSRTTNLPSISSFTMMGWFYISTDRNDYSTFLFLGSTGSSCYQLQTNATGTNLAIWTGVDEVAGTNLSTGTWYHLAVTVNGTSGSNCLVYLNGVLDITATARNNTGGSFRIGNSPISEFLNGRAAAVKVYGAVLTAAEIINEMRYYLPQRTANLNSFYPLLSVSDDDIDYSGSGNTLTVGGTLATEDGPPIGWRRGPSKLWLPVAGGTDVTVSMTTNSAAFSTPSPSVLFDFVVALSAQSAAFSQPALSVVTDQILSLSPQVAIFSQPAPTVAIGIDVTAGVNSAAFTNPSPQVITDAILAINPVTAQFTVISPTVIAGGDVSVDLAAQVAQFSQGLGQVVTDSTIVISPVTATFTLNSPEVIITIPSTATISRVSIWLAIR